MMVRFLVLAAVMVVVVIVSGGCTERSSPPSETRPGSTATEATQNEATGASSAGERALARENERYRKRIAESLDARACEVTRSGPPPPLNARPGETAGGLGARKAS